MKSNIWIFIVLAGLFTAFAAISMLVYFTGGKNAKLIKRKLAIGASIIALTGVVNGCRPVVTCYDVAPSPIITCTDSVSSNGEVVISNNDLEIMFDCMYAYYESVSFRVLTGSNVVVSDSCNIIREQDLTKMIVRFPIALNYGNYKLGFYYYRPNEIPEDATPFYQFDLKVSDI